MPIDEEQFVQSHTPFRTFVEQYRNDHVVMLGGHGSIVKEMEVARIIHPLA